MLAFDKQKVNEFQKLVFTNRRTSTNCERHCYISSSVCWTFTDVLRLQQLSSAVAIHFFFLHVPNVRFHAYFGALILLDFSLVDKAENGAFKVASSARGWGRLGPRRRRVTARRSAATEPLHIFRGRRRIVFFIGLECVKEKTKHACSLKECVAHQVYSQQQLEMSLLPPSFSSFGV